MADVGTSSNQWKKNLTGEQDICRWTHIYENYINTHGNECVDVKEGTLDTIIEKNYCTGQLDEDSAGEKNLNTKVFVAVAVQSMAE